MKKQTTFYIVRHGKSEANEKGIISGHADFPLSDTGKVQAIERAKELKDIHFDAAFSSDLSRARETAELIIGERSLAISATQVLRERNQEGIQGSSYDELGEELKRLLDEYNAMNYQERFSYKIVPGMESDEEVIVRFTNFLKKTAQEYSGKTVLIVAHGNMMRTLLVHLGVGTHQELGHGAAKNTSYFVLKTDGETFEIEKTVGIEKKQA